MGLFQNKIYLSAETHQYYHKTTGEEYTSVSKLLRLVQEPFDAEKMSHLSAGKLIREDATGAKLDVDTVAAQLRQDWKQKGTEAADHGTNIHRQLENYGKTTRSDRQYEEMCRAVYYLFREHKQISYAEEIAVSETYKVAGTIDKPLCRTSGSKGTWDIRDFKTNISKGIQYHSKYGKYLKSPFQHLEECNYNLYSLQLSCYALMAEECGFKVGNLAIIFLDNFDLSKPKLIPLPYCKFEAMELMRLSETNNLYMECKTPLPLNCY